MARKLTAQTKKDITNAIDALRIAVRALDYYANPGNYNADDWGVRAVVAEYGNAGKKARNALRRIEKLTVKP